jgi:hypothetical protein
MKRKLPISIAACLLLALAANLANAGDDAAGPDPAQREKMAQKHEKIAACLRSTRPAKECMQEMSGCKMMSQPGGDSAPAPEHKH